MSTTEDVRLEGAKLDESERTISRAVAEFQAGNGRTIDVRIVPYGVATEVSDGGPLYREMWMPGAFADQVRGAAAGRARQVFVNFEHGNRLSDVVGHGLTLREDSDGFYGSFELHDTADGEKARYMVEQRVLDGVSLEAFPKKSVRSKDGIVQRVKAHLVNIALCRQPAYENAGVLALREEVLMQEIVAAPELSDAIRDRCHRLGIVLPGEEVEIIERAFTEQPWDGSSSRWDTAAAYCSACVIDLNPSGKPKTKQMCYLPVREPGSGDVNVNAVRAALSRLGAGFPKSASQSQRSSAQAALERMLAQANGSTASASRAAPAATMEETAAAGEQAAIGHIESMLEMAQEYMQAEPDAEDKATMARIMGLLRELHQTDAAEAN